LNYIDDVAHYVTYRSNTCGNTQVLINVYWSSWFKLINQIPVKQAVIEFSVLFRSNMFFEWAPYNEYWKNSLCRLFIDANRIIQEDFVAYGIGFNLGLKTNCRLMEHDCIWAAQGFKIPSPALGKYYMSKYWFWSIHRNFRCNIWLKFWEAGKVSLCNQESFHSGFKHLKLITIFRYDRFVTAFHLVTASGINCLQLIK